MCSIINSVHTFFSKIILISIKQNMIFSKYFTNGIVTALPMGLSPRSTIPILRGQQYPFSAVNNTHSPRSTIPILRGQQYPFSAVNNTRPPRLAIPAIGGWQHLPSAFGSRVLLLQGQKLTRRCAPAPLGALRVIRRLQHFAKFARLLCINIHF